MEDKTLYIATISGGKDSVAMVDLLLKNNYPVDYIVFNDTKLEFKEMYEYMEKVKKYIKEKYDKEIITLKSEKELFKDIIFGRISKRSKKWEGYIRGTGFYSPYPQYCLWRRDGKVNIFNKWLRSILKKHNTKKYKLYIGFTLDEVKRKSKDKNILYPLIDDFKMTEKCCLEYTKKIGLYNPLYNYFNRTGCSICPFTKKADIYKLYKYFPELFEQVKEIEKKLEKLSKTEKVKNTKWFLCGDTEMLEREFKKIEKLENKKIF